MSSNKAPKTTAKMPDDPDPTPLSTADPTPEVQGAARSERKKAAKSYGRQQTILAGNANQSRNNTEKKTILGG